MTQKIQVVQGGVVVNILSVGDAATLSEGAIVLADASRISPPAGATFMSQAGAGMRWTLTGSTLVAPVPATPTLTKAQLAAYANTIQWGLATGGHHVTVAGTAYLFATDTNSLSLITGKAVRLQLPSAPTSVDWQFADGSYVTLSAADFITIAANIADFIQSTFDALKVALDAISAGTITTTAQIDAAAWPAV